MSNKCNNIYLWKNSQINLEKEKWKKYLHILLCGLLGLSLVACSAIETLTANVIEYQSLDVDTVSGASFTSRGLLNGIAEAVEAAGGDVVALKAVKPEVTLATDDLTT